MDFSSIDHLVVAAPTLEEGSHWAHKLFDIQPEPGGIHQGLGTHNILLGLGDSCYLEIIAPDPKQNDIPKHWIPADNYIMPQLIGWASPSKNILSLKDAVPDTLGDVSLMSRQKPDGSTISWSMSYPRFDLFNGLLPFLIQWPPGLHPGKNLKQIGTIIQFQLYHPEHENLEKQLDQMGIYFPVIKSEKPHIEAKIKLSDERTITIK